MSKRRSLTESVDPIVKRAVAAKEPDAESIAPDEYTASAVNLRKSDWKFLRRVAEGWAENEGGRISVSGVLQRLIDKHRDELEKIRDGVKRG